MKAAQNFNYKAALGAGLKSLQSGRLRQAEDQFRYLVSHFPAADGGYRGLAKVLVELEDRAAALQALRDGASAMSREGERAGAIVLLREAIGLDPSDLGTHRRLSATLAVAGDLDGAAHELERYVDVVERRGEASRATSEIAYALERLGALPEVVALAERFGVDVPRTAAEVAERPTGPDTTEPGTAEDPTDTTDLVAAERRAAELLAARDRRAGAVALAVARAHLAAGHQSAASDLLLQVVVSGTADHEAQLALVEVARALGRPDLAAAKCALLADAMRLAGDHDLANEVERYAATI